MQVDATGSHASNKKWELPEDLVTELSNIENESVEAILDRYNLPIKYDASAAVQQDAPPAAVPESAFMTALLNEPDARTANDAPAYSSSNDPLVDLFWELGPAASIDTIILLLENAWKKDPTNTLKIIWQARSIHEGKGIREAIFYELIGFLYREHPRTLIANLHLFVDKECTRSDLAVKLEENVDELVEREGVSHGYYKDLLNVLVLALSGGFEQDGTAASSANNTLRLGQHSKQFSQIKSTHRNQKLPKSTKKGLYGNKKFQAANVPKDSALYFMSPATSKGDKHAAFTTRLHGKLATDSKFRALYIVVSKLFAESMKKDLHLLEELDKATSETRYTISSKMTLAAKWAPTPAKAHDRQLFMATAISAVLFPGTQGTVEKRMSYQTEVLTPLRKALDITEVKMASGRWKEINYGRCPSKCMARNKLHFFIHDEERFGKYIASVMKGTKKISGATLLPHELVIEAMKLSTILPGIEKLPGDKLARWFALNGNVVDAQWNSLVRSLKEASATGTGLNNCIAVVDVSGSMGTVGHTQDPAHPQPIDVAIALGLVTAQLAEPPFNGAFITFSERPSIVKLQENLPLSAMIGSMSTADWSMSTNFHAVFKLLLDVAIKNNLKKEDMIKIVFVFSDMQFDAACSSDGWNETVHQSMSRSFEDAGYDLPELVYWNIQGGEGVTGTLPARADQPGVQLLSGYSPSMMKTFLSTSNATEQVGLESVPEVDEAASDDDEDDCELVELPEAEKMEGKKDLRSKEAAKTTPAMKLAQILANPSFEKLRVLD